MNPELRQYQMEAIEAWLKVGHGTLALAPGSGKTLVAVRTIKRMRNENPMLRVLVIVPTLVLSDQWKAVLDREGELAKIVTYQWAAPRADHGEFWRQWDLIIADESHHLAIGEVFRQLLIPIHAAQYAMGLTATPPQPVDGEENLSLRVLPIVYTYSFAEGREQGYTAEIEVVPIPVSLTPEEHEAYRHLTSMIREMIAVYGENYQSRPWVGPNYEPLQGPIHQAPGDPYPKRIFGGTITNARRQLVALADQKFGRLDRLMFEVLNLGQQVPDDEPYARVFVWSEYVEVLEKAKAVLNRNGQIAELVTGKTPKKERVRIIQEAWGRDFPILLVARVGEEGLDAPESAVGVVLAGAKTQRQTIQRLGRLLRPFPGKKAKLYVIYAKGVPMDEKVVALMNEVSA